MISSTSNNRRRLIGYLLVSIGCGLFSFVYEHYAHQVYSNYMVYLFAIPLLLGALPALLTLLIPKLSGGTAWRRTTQAFAIAALTVGALLQGMLEIYGTTSPYVKYYLVAGGGFLIISGGLWSMAQIKPDDKHTPTT